MTRVLHVSAVRGDGTQAKPFGTFSWAELHLGPGDVISIDNADEAPPASRAWPHLLLLLAAWTGSWAYVCLIVVALLGHPALAAVLVALPILVCLVPRRRSAP